MIEAAVLALLGGIGGVALAFAGLKGLVAIAPESVGTAGQRVHQRHGPDVDRRGHHDQCVVPRRVVGVGVMARSLRGGSESRWDAPSAAAAGFGRR